MKRYSIQQLQDQVLMARATGADRERLRIRRVLKRAAHDGEIWYLLSWDEIDAATRAPRRGRKR